MTNEERDLITQFVSRVGGVANSGGFAGSVPSGGQQGVAPVDHDADGLIADLFNRYPEARYRITQLAFVQERALANAQQQIAQLQQAAQQMHQAGGPASGQSPQQSRGFFGNLFGGGGQPQQPQSQQYAPPPQQQYAPQQPAGGMFQPQGTGFLGGALRTAAGVAGGVVAADALMGLFSGRREGGGMFGGNVSGPGGGDYYPPPVADNSPWGGGNAGGADPYDQGGAMKDPAGSDQYADNSAWQPAPDQGGIGGGDLGGGDTGGGGWDQGSVDDGGGWTDSSGDA